MRKRRGLGSAIVGLTLGLFLGFLMLNYRIITPTTSNLQRSGSLTSRQEEIPRNTKTFDQNLQSRESSKNLVFVGVMTANKFLGTRAKAVYETWGKNVPGKIAFFSSEFSVVPDNRPDLPLVTLPTVDDAYPPQKKSFLMLQYMWNNFGDQYEWFLRADDDVYVRTDRLETLLRSVDSKKAMYIGQAGRGKSEEFGLLSLEYDENFCMGGPGVIMSRETLKRIVPHIKYCLKNLYTTHEDVELGRCVQKYAGIPCTWSYEVNLFSFIYLTIHYTRRKNQSIIIDAFRGTTKKIARAVKIIALAQNKKHVNRYSYIVFLSMSQSSFFEEVFRLVLDFSQRKLRGCIEFLEFDVTIKT